MADQELRDGTARPDASDASRISDVAAACDLDNPLTLHRLVYLEENGEVTIGRPDIESFAILPPDGAALVRRLQEGSTPRQAADWYAAEYGEPIDVADIVEALYELDFVRSEPGPAPKTVRPVRWQRLGQALFSPMAWLCYGAVVAWATVLMVRSPDLLPSPRAMVFSDYYSLIMVVMTVAAAPLIAIHEVYHALAGRRLGIGSRTRMSYRFYFLVVETSLDGLVVVERRKRYLPILAGMIVDVVLVGVLIIVADFTRGPDGVGLAGRVCLAVAFAAVIRVLWQFFFYLRTDIYVLISTALGCVDLHTTATRMLRNRCNRLLGRPDRLLDESEWHPADRRAARWYSWLIPVGYTLSLSTFLLGLGPVFFDMIGAVLGRFTADRPNWGMLVDGTVFLLLTFLQIGIALWLAARDRLRRRRERTRHVIA
ncbi:hypothetical protein ABZ990_04920 [Streptomyces sp. NPDC046203]|uniref:hypothetical protein n=1 Tax=Streptomyces sp. NPDC046203 TaxID=3154602 RepID=UPI0033CA6923